jgi:chorismate mutase
MSSSPDEVVRELRAEIADVDRAIVDAVNARLELVARLKRHKEERGIPFLDPDRERELVDELVDANRGPLTAEGLRELYAEILELVKRELAPDGRPGS